METTVFNKAQLDLLRIMSFVKTDESMKELKNLIVCHFAQKAKQEMDKMWETGEMNENKYNEFRNLHERTPYRRARKSAYLI